MKHHVMFLPLWAIKIRMLVYFTLLALESYLRRWGWMLQLDIMDWVITSLIECGCELDLQNLGWCDWLGHEAGRETWRLSTKAVKLQRQNLLYFRFWLLLLGCSTTCWECSVFTKYGRPWAVWASLCMLPRIALRMSELQARLGTFQDFDRGAEALKGETQLSWPYRKPRSVPTLHELLDLNKSVMVWTATTTNRYWKWWCKQIGLEFKVKTKI